MMALQQRHLGDPPAPGLLESSPFPLCLLNNSDSSNSNSNNTINNIKIHIINIKTIINKSNNSQLISYKNIKSSISNNYSSNCAKNNYSSSNNSSSYGNNINSNKDCRKVTGRLLNSRSNRKDNPNYLSRGQHHQHHKIASLLPGKNRLHPSQYLPRRRRRIKNLF